MNKKLLHILYPLLISVFFTATSNAQNFWMEIVLPDNAEYRAIAFNSEQILYVATDKGLYRSYNNGITFNDRVFLNYTGEIYINKENLICIQTSPTTLHYSINNDETWIASELPVQNACNINKIYTFSNIFLTANWCGIYKTANYGESWQTALQLSPSQNVTSLARDSEGVLFAGLINYSINGDGGVYRSFDNGTSWELCGLNYEFISDIAVNSKNELFATSRGHFFEGGGGVFRSSDKGETWMELRNDVLATSVAITQKNKIYLACTGEHGHQGGIFFSEDNGESWCIENSGLTSENMEDIALGSSGFLFSMNKYFQLFRSLQPVSGVRILDKKNSNIKVNIYKNNEEIIVYVKINFQEPFREKIYLYLFNTAGIMLNQKILETHETNCLIRIPVNNLPSGIYFIQIKSGNYIYSKKIIF